MSPRPVMPRSAPPSGSGEARALRGGFALVTILLILTALGLLATGLVFIAAEESTISQGMESRLRGRLAAESSVRAALAGWRAEEYHDLEIGAVREIGPEVAGSPPGGSSITVERLAGPLYLLQAHVTARDGMGTRATAIIRSVNAAELLPALPAALTTAGPIELWDSNAVEGFSPEVASGEEVAECLAPALQEIHAAFGGTERPAVQTIPADLAATYKLGPLDTNALSHLADRVETQALSPWPTESDAGCETMAHGNWGEPLRPDSPCARYFPVINAPDGLHLSDGQGQGILVVDGDLTIAGETEFFGVLIVAGRLTLRDRARVAGAAIIHGAAYPTLLLDESRLTYEPCAIMAALKNTTALNRAFHPGDRAWIPQF